MNGVERGGSMSGLRLIVRDFLVYLEPPSGNGRAFGADTAFSQSETLVKGDSALVAL